MDELILILVGAFLSAILALIKITIIVTMSWWIVLFPLLLCIFGVFIFMIDIDL